MVSVYQKPPRSNVWGLFDWGELRYIFVVFSN